MPRYLEPKKDVVSCEKPRGAASGRGSVDIRMGEPGGFSRPSLRSEVVREGILAL